MGIINTAIANLIPIIPKSMVGHFAKKYIAGESLQEATDAIERLNDEGYLCTVNILGEHLIDIEDSAKYVTGYKDALSTIIERNQNANISIKLSQLGMGIDDKICLRNIKELLTLATEADSFVRIDMEESTYTTKTLDIHSELLSLKQNVGTVIQAYLRRSEADVTELSKIKANIRICKGIYVESEKIAFKDKDMIRKNFVRLLEILFKGGSYVGIATHDEHIVYEAYRVIDELGLGKEQYEFQMIYGVREQLRKKILDDGHQVRVYVPYGKAWYAYSTRRLKENPEIAGYIIKNIFSFNSGK
ncbi:MAG: proline dehydrogenase family protein [Candidatus Marinimicrobia bacterium]|nr:proline dehydrogenase family protein [Candidatus Neomarinimicrobiota bacterium]